MSVTVGDTVDGAALVAEVEALGARAAAARAEVGRVIFGQDEVVDQVLVCLLSGGHVLLVGVPGLGKTLLVETLGTVLGLAPKRVQFTPDLMPADITGSRGAGRGCRRAAVVPVRARAGVLPAADGRRDQPRQPAHAVGAAAGDGGGQGRRGGARPSPAPAVPRAGDAEPDRAGRHLPAAGGAAGPVLAAGGRALPRPGQRARDAAGDHRVAGWRAPTGAERRGAAGGAGADPPGAGRGERGGRDPDPGARRAAGHGGGRHGAPARRLGAGAARGAGADARHAGAGAAGRPAVAHRWTTWPRWRTRCCGTAWR